jgi:tetratricopeptide (TPR) repeat protein
MTRTELLNRAAHCYLSADLLDDACRCFEQLEDYARAARLHERQERWEPAARCYERARTWADAARCYLQCALPEEAARCLLKTDNSLDAAWILAEQAHRFERAYDISQAIMPTGLAEALAVKLITARCQAGWQHPEQAVVILGDVLRRLAELEANPERQRLETWALTVAEVLQRPDLSATFHAAAVVAGTPGAVRRWEVWALQHLGDATGVPLENALPEDAWEAGEIDAKGSSSDK